MSRVGDGARVVGLMLMVAVSLSANESVPTVVDAAQRGDLEGGALTHSGALGRQQG